MNQGSLNFIALKNAVNESINGMWHISFTVGVKLSISSTFLAHIFCTKVLSAAFLQFILAL